jgi:ADP-ribose pyrophosphatase YjhB (NUDIX family)
MTRQHRIAAGGIVFKDDKLLLVRYHDQILVSPGGKLEDDENFAQAVIREVKEETDLLVQPLKVVAIEDLITPQFKMMKVWMLCDYCSGEIQNTQESEKEGIVEAGWFSKTQLIDEEVYPSFLMNIDWKDLHSENWQVLWMPTRVAKF